MYEKQCKVNSRTTHLERQRVPQNAPSPKVIGNFGDHQTRDGDVQESGMFEK